MVAQYQNSAIQNGNHWSPIVRAQIRDLQLPEAWQGLKYCKPPNFRRPKHSRFGTFWISRPFNLAIAMEI
jgi:hypothetical protein